MSNESIGYWDDSDKPKSTGYQDPFYQVTHVVTGATQPMPYAQVPLTQHLNEPSLQAIRKIVREAVHRELHPEPLSGEPLSPIINRSYVGVEVAFTDFDGQEYRGVLYPTKVDK